LVHLVDGLLNRFLEMPPGIVTVLSGYRNHFGNQGVAVVSMAALAATLLETGFHEVSDEFADLTRHRRILESDPLEKVYTRTLSDQAIGRFLWRYTLQSPAGLGARRATVPVAA
jgi:hypothetical protein